jgi:hypothetical protein
MNPVASQMLWLSFMVAWFVLKSAQLSKAKIVAISTH